MIAEIFPHVLHHEIEFELLPRGARDASRGDCRQTFVQAHICWVNINGHRPTRHGFTVDFQGDVDEVKLMGSNESSVDVNALEQQLEQQKLEQVNQEKIEKARSKQLRNRDRLVEN